MSVDGGVEGPSGGRTLGDAGRVAIWMVGFASLLGLPALVGDAGTAIGVVWVTATIIAWVLLGVWVARWWLIALPAAFAALLAVLSTTTGTPGFEEPSFGIVLLFTEMIVAAPWTLALMLAIGFRKR